MGHLLTIELNILETTIANLAEVLAGGALDGAVIDIGGQAGREISGKEIILTPLDGTESWTFKNAVPSGSVEILYSPTGDRIYKAMFTALVDEASVEDENLAQVS